MEVNVSQLLQSPIGTERTYEVDEFVDIFGDGNCHHVTGHISLVRTNRSILAHDRLFTEVPLTCGRCLSLFDYPLDLDIEEEFLPTIDVITGAPVPVPYEPGNFTIDEHHVIDFTEAVRQYTELAIPMKPLCRVDCAGLCQTCGKNLNQGSCRCAKSEIDPRWAKLLKLK